MEELILHLIGQYYDVSDGGGVGASMLANWLGITRQGANYHLRKLYHDKLIMRKNIGNRGAIPTYRYVLGEKAQEFYDDGKFKREYFEYVYHTKTGAFVDKMFSVRKGENY